jgi:diguanylate cyclase
VMELRVLLVEDDDDDRVLAEACLAELPGTTCVVTWVTSAPAGIEAIRSGAYDIALLDYHLGAQTGLDVLASVRGTPTPCILLTGQQNLDADIAAMEAGASDYIVKQGLDADVLGRSIRYALERSEHLRSLEETRAQLAYDALHDPLTGIANRAMFIRRAEQVLHERATASSIYTPAVLFLDLDNFKDVNDSKGHLAGDQVLIEIATRLQSLETEGVLVSRLGGDEFAILLQQVESQSEAEAFASSILTAINAPIVVDNSQVNIGGSVGIAIVNQVDLSVADLMRNADVAMYVAKKIGSNRIRMFADHMHTAIMERLQLERELRVAIDSGQIVAFFQPIFDIDSGDIVSFEALARWNHPVHGIIAPGIFIGIAEDTGMIVDIGRIILEQAIERLSHWRASFPRASELTVSVNLSPRQIEDPKLVPTINDILDRHHCDPRLLQLEITESLMVNQAAGSLDRINSISTLGIRLAMDDFGTGYSSLSYLQDLPLSVIKIDRVFVSRVNDPRGAALVTAIIAMADSLGHLTIAEGIETEEQLHALQVAGCRRGQGSLCAMPLLPEQIEHMMAGSSPWVIPVAIHSVAD